MTTTELAVRDGAPPPAGLPRGECICIRGYVPSVCGYIGQWPD